MAPTVTERRLGSVAAAALAGWCALAVAAALTQPSHASQGPPREITGKDGVPMLLVPEGEFLYGDEQQRVSLPAFYMDKHEVARARYEAFLQATGPEKPQFWDDARFAGDERPVVVVTWHDAEAYCRYYGKRLPTDQEWEKAARGTDGPRYPYAGQHSYGILAMGENVFEWTSSDYGRYLKVVRGRATVLDGQYPEAFLSHRTPPDRWGTDLGFRCVQDVR